MRRHSETLEERTLLTGGLTVDINGGADPFVRVDTAGDADVEFRGFDSSDDLALATFFSAADGAAVPTTVDASLSVDGRTITGTFTLDEFDSGNGVSIIAVDAGIQFGGPVGIELSDADGVFALLTSGLAGQITAEDVSDGDGIAVFGLAGLELDSAFGFDFQINTTDDAVDLSVDAPFGTQTISFATGGVHQLQGAAVFHVDSAIGRVVSRGCESNLVCWRRRCREPCQRDGDFLAGRRRREWAACLRDGVRQFRGQRILAPPDRQPRYGTGFGNR